MHKRVVCHFCKARCRIVMHTENGLLVGFDEDPSFPIKTNYITCPRIRLIARDFMYHPDRLNFPLKRSGDRGEGKWQKISWAQAFMEIADKLQVLKERFGAEGLAILRGTARMNEFEAERFANLFGTPNHGGQIVVCLGPGITLTTAMFGWTTWMAPNIPNKASTGCILLAGAELSQSMQGLWNIIRQKRKAGAKLIVIDPRETIPAREADLWLQIKPATDTALLMGMINVIIEENLYDREFIDRWCYGFDKLRERAAGYTPEKVADITWVSAEKIREAARMYAANRPAIKFHGLGLEHQSNSVVSGIQAVNILSAITGNVDACGGDVLTGPSPDFVPHEIIEADDRLPAEQADKQIGCHQFQLMSWKADKYIQEPVRKLWGARCASGKVGSNAHVPSIFRAMLTNEPYPVRAAMIIGSNALLDFANSKLVYQALKSLDLVVVNEYWMTPTAEIADYILPVASWMERPWLWDRQGTDSMVYGGEQGLSNFIKDKYDHKSDWEIMRGIGIRLGQDWPWENLEQVFDYRLSPRKTNFKEFMMQGGFSVPSTEFKKYEKMGGFATRTGKCELYSTVLEKFGLDPLPQYEEAFETSISKPEMAQKYPLILITGGRFMPMFHSEFRQLGSARRLHPDPLVQIHPETAKNLDIEDGNWVWIETCRGKIKMKCQFFTGIDPRVVHCEHGWWFPEMPAGEPGLHGVWESNVNVLLEDNPECCNKGTGSWPLRTSLCKIYKSE
jgi:thiosulfate reductase / polysulfide reductase chain A